MISYERGAIQSPEPLQYQGARYSPRRADGLLVPAPRSVRKSSVRLFKAADRAFGVERSFRQGFRVPLAPVRGIEEITAVDMDGAGQAGNRIGDRMNDVAPERRRVPRAQRRCAGRLDLARAVGQAAPEDVVLAPGIDADDGPH